MEKVKSFVKKVPPWAIVYYSHSAPRRVDKKGTPRVWNEWVECADDFTRDSFLKNFWASSVPKKKVVNGKVWDVETVILIEVSYDED